MTAGDMRTEVFARGFQYLNDGSTEAARVLQWVNDAVTEINEEADWPFLEATTTGNAPLALTRARNVESVVNTTDGVELDWAPRRWIMDIYGTPPAGTPKYWYVEHLATDTLTVVVAPTAADGLSVRYFQHQTALATGDTSIIPARFHWLAVVRRDPIQPLRPDDGAELDAVDLDGVNHGACSVQTAA